MLQGIKFVSCVKRATSVVGEECGQIRRVTTAKNMTDINDSDSFLLENKSYCGRINAFINHHFRILVPLAGLSVAAIIVISVIVAVSVTQETNSTTSVRSPDIITIFPHNWTVTGVRQDVDNMVAITGTQSSNPTGNISLGFIYYGLMSDIPDTKNSESLHYFIPHFPGESPTFAAMYGPNTYKYFPAVGKGNILAVGGYNYAESPYQAGFIYEGPLNGTGKYTKIIIPPRHVNVTFPNGTTITALDYPTHTVAHSTMGELIVGDCYFESSTTKSYGFLYNLKKKTFIRLVELDLFSTSMYGVWQNDGVSSNQYTMVGGLTHLVTNLSMAYIMNYNAVVDEFSMLRTYTYLNKPQGGVHFEGISGVDGGYTCAAIGLSSTKVQSSAIAFIPVYANGSFADAQWFEITVPGSSFVSANTILDFTILGIYQTSPKVKGQAFIPENSFYANCTGFV